MGNTILLADKSITIQKIVQLTFADDDFNIHCVSDGQAALDIIPQIRPDVVLADISLPAKSGYDICSALRTDPGYSAFSKVPVILLAGIYETMDEERARQVEERVKQVEANDFLSKPFDPQLLISKVKQYLSGSGAQQETPPSSIFAQEPESAINLFETESPVRPPDDAEKTVMLPGGPFGSIFPSEPAPYEEETPIPESSRPTIDIEAVKPVNEPIFAEENFPPVELGAEQEEEEEQNFFGQSTLKMNLPPAEEDRFTGRQEQEFEYRSGPILEAPFTSRPEPESIPLILPNAEDPFGDVFQEPQGQWSSPAASEEDSPFGMPEPPPLPEPLEEKVLPFEVETEPKAGAESTPIAAAPEQETYEDTWPGVPVRPNMTHPVEELFESEPSPISLTEEAEELEEDLSASTQEEPDSISLVETPESEAEPVPASAAPISDDLIDRIAERVLNKLSERVVSEIVWQVVPDLAEKMIRREIEKLHAGEE